MTTSDVDLSSTIVTVVVAWYQEHHHTSHICHCGVKMACT